jgi:predicted GNAT family acetyltransferase
VEIERFDDPGPFLQSTRAFLLREEAANNLILGVAAGAASGDYGSFEGWVVRGHDEILAVAAQTPPHSLLLARTAVMEAIDSLAEVTTEVPGVVAAVPEVERFASHRSHAVCRVRQGIYQLAEVRTAIEPGSRPATRDDRALLLGWMAAFMQEVTGDAPDPEAARRNLERRLDRPEGVAGVWVHEVDDEVVCMSGYIGPTAHGIRVGPVYTPPEHRGKGHASRLVAAQSEWLLDHGRRFCFLYTDLDNPTSNAIYKRIGYEMVCESAEYTFSR